MCDTGAVIPDKNMSYKLVTPCQSISPQYWSITAWPSLSLSGLTAHNAEKQSNGVFWQDLEIQIIFDDWKRAKTDLIN